MSLRFIGTSIELLMRVIYESMAGMVGISGEGWGMVVNEWKQDETWVVNNGVGDERLLLWDWLNEVGELEKVGKWDETQILWRVGECVGRMVRVVSLLSNWSFGWEYWDICGLSQKEF